MPALREALTSAGYRHVRTYVQSGNILLDTRQGSDRLSAGITQLLAEQFGIDVPVVIRTVDELAEIVRRNPFGPEAKTKPKALQVTFRNDEVTPELLDDLKARAAPSEKVAGSGREIYTWHPDGIARSKLALAVTPRYAAATARNWTTVLTLLEMASTDVG